MIFLPSVGLCIVATGSFFLEALSAATLAEAPGEIEAMVTVYPEEYPGALRNPMKGFRNDLSEVQARYGTIVRHYIKWNSLENHETDTIQKIKDFCDEAWEGIEALGVKVIPRVYLDWDRADGNEYWPADMVEGDYTSDQFKERVKRLVARLGECWDHDPRVAWVQMGIVGYWGEHHSPEPSAEVEAILGEAFAAAFKNKRVLVRRPVDFTEFDVGFYWDSWAHIQQIDSENHGLGIDELNIEEGRWKTHPIEGETAYNWGRWKEQPGDDPNDTLSDSEHREFLIDSIRRLHCSGLGWIARFDDSISEVRAGAEEVQKAFGYRFVVKEFSCSREADMGGELEVSFVVENVGSAPFYENWPVEFSLINPETREVAWSTILYDIDIREWLPGDDWDDSNDLYRIPAKAYRNDARVSLPGSSWLAEGVYYASLAILDPLGGEPQVRFAVKNFFEGGRHPFARVGIGVSLQEGGPLEGDLFDDPMDETRVAYALEMDSQADPKLSWRVEVVDGLVHLFGYCSGMKGRGFVQRSANLTSENWDTVREISGLDSWFQLSEKMESDVPARFYRIVFNEEGDF